MTPLDFFTRAMPAAIEGGHIWPEFAICEAAEESAWGESELARRANNLFGQKRGRCDGNYPMLALPTKEWDGTAFVPCTCDWPVFPDWPTAFRERMATLRALAPEIPAYAAALKSVTGPGFVTRVSKAWSTDPKRAANVLAIYEAHVELLEDLMTRFGPPHPASPPGGAEQTNMEQTKEASAQ